MKPEDLVPSSESDLMSARRALAAGWPTIKPVVDALLEWIQDTNWPVAPIIRDLLRPTGGPLADHLRPILDGTDDIWKYGVITCLLTGDVDPSLVDQLREVLTRIAERPRPGEVEEELPAAARQALLAA